MGIRTLNKGAQGERLILEGRGEVACARSVIVVMLGR